ncbi:MAG: phosphohistidine phosphatase SixA [Longimicrobiales bacterium]
MEVYLSQHGKAESEEEDPRRPLSAEGREETERVARAAAIAGIRVDAVWHSTKLRARQTAEIFAEALKPVNGIHEQDWLGPLDDPRTAVEAARETEEAVLMVGHLPHLSRLPSLLLTGDPEHRVVDVRFSGIIALAEREEGWVLSWYLRPELLPA